MGNNMAFGDFFDDLARVFEASRAGSKSPRPIYTKRAKSPVVAVSSSAL